MAAKVALNGQDAAPGCCQSCCSPHQDGANCSVISLHFSHSPISYLAFLSLSSSLLKMNSEGGMSELSVICQLSRVLSFLTARNFWTLFVMPEKPRGCTIAIDWKRRARLSGRPCKLVWTAVSTTCIVCARHTWVRITGNSLTRGTGLEFLMQNACNYRCIKKGLVKH